MTFTTRMFAKTLLLTTALSFIAAPGIEKAYAAFEWTPPVREEAPSQPAPQQEEPAPSGLMTPEIATPAPAEPVPAPAPVTAAEPSVSVPPTNAVDIFAEPGAAVPPPAAVPAQTLIPPAPQQDIKTEVVTSKEVPAPVPQPVVNAQPAPAATPTPVLVTPPVTTLQPVKDSNDVLQGFGNDLPLIMAVRQIVPANVSYAFGDGVDLSHNVSWSGGDTWQNTLRKITDELHYELIVDGNNLRIMARDKAAAQPVLTAPTPAVAEGPAPKGIAAKVEQEVGAEVVELAPPPSVTNTTVKPLQLPASVTAPEAPVALSAPEPVVMEQQPVILPPETVESPAAPAPAAPSQGNMGEVQKSLEDIVKEAEKAMGMSANDKAVTPPAFNVASDAPAKNAAAPAQQPEIVEITEADIVGVETAPPPVIEKPVTVVEESVTVADDIFISNADDAPAAAPVAAEIVEADVVIVEPPASEAMETNQVMERNLADLLEQSGSNYDDPFAMVDEGRPATSATSLTPGQIIKSPDDLAQDDMSSKSVQAPDEKFLTPVEPVAEETKKATEVEEKTPVAAKETAPVIAPVVENAKPPAVKDLTSAQETTPPVVMAEEPVNIVTMKEPVTASVPEKTTDPVQVPLELEEPAPITAPAPDVAIVEEEPPVIADTAAAAIVNIKDITAPEERTPVAAVRAGKAKYEDVQTWKVKKGADLKETVMSWSEQAGVKVDWKLEEKFKVDYMVWVDGTFEEAINTLMQGYTNRQGIKPMAQFKAASKNGPVLSVRSSI